VVTSARETKSEGPAAEWWKDQKWVASWRRRHGKSLGYPTTSQGYPGSSGRYAQEWVWESSQSVGWGSTSWCTEVDHEGSHGSLEAYWVCIATERNGRCCACGQLSGRRPEVAEQQVGDMPWGL